MAYKRCLLFDLIININTFLDNFILTTLPFQMSDLSFSALEKPDYETSDSEGDTYERLVYHS